MNNIKKLFIACSAMATISSVTVGSVLGYTGIVDKETVRLREEASTSSKILTNLDYGDKVDIISEDDEWYKVKYKSYEGYMYKEYIKVDNNNSSDETDSDSNTSVEPTEEPENNQEPEESSEEAEETTPTKTPEITASFTETNKNETKYVGLELELNKDVSVHVLPVITSSSIGNISSGTKIKIIQETNNWVKVSSLEKKGWIFKSIISKINETDNEKPEVTPEPTETPEPTPTEEPKPNETTQGKGVINVESANVRDKASTSGEVIGSLSKDDEVTILGEEEDFYKISTATIKEGYVAKRLITVDTLSSRSGEAREDTTDVNQIPENEEEDFEEDEDEQDEVYNYESNTSSDAQDIVDFAEQFLGYDYTYGGTNPDTGFDCSGFTYYVYSNNGISISRSLSDQAELGVEVSEDEIEIGDLIIFQDESMSGIGHSGIYIGGGRFIHAANPSRGVVTDSMSNTYYNPRIVTIRRVV